MSAARARAELVVDAERATSRLEEALAARDRGETVDICEAAEADTAPFDEAEETALMLHCGGILRDHDPAMYRLLRGALAACAALAIAPVEN